jgi:hypothetical protein
MATELQGLQCRQVRAQAGPRGWLAVYTTATWGAGLIEDVMTAYLPIVLGQGVL